MTRCASSFFALSMCLISIANTACGDGDGTGGGTTSSGTTSSETTSSGTTSSEATGGGGNGGGPDQACDHEKADGGSEAPTCGPGEVRIAGDIDGKHVDETLTPGWGMAVAHTFLELPKFGLLYFPSVEAQPDEATAGRALIRFPDDTQLADSWYCAGYGSEASVGATSFVPFTATLDSLSLLGSCESGTPVSGEVENCLEATECGAWSSVSTIEGASFNVDIAGGYSGYSTVSKEGELGLVFYHPESTAPLSGSGFFKVEAPDLDDSELDTNKTAPLARGFFIVPLGAPDAGAVYCTGEGSSLEYKFDSQGNFVPQRSTFKNLKRIGACPAANACLPGQLQICDKG